MILRPFSTAVFLLILFTCGDRLTGEEIDRDDLGRSVKLTILVDKVMQPEADWVTEEWMVRATAEAGFNVFSPRQGHDRLDEVERVGQWCAKYGIYFMPWMRGSLSAPKGPQADGKRLVWASGNEQPLYSPNSDEFWEWTNRYIIEYAKISARNQHLIGVFLDYENYAAGKEGNLYSLSYDDVIVGEFAESKQVQLPDLPPAERKGWLESRELHKEFSEFQIDHWRQRCRALRESVDQLDPKFQFCVYPAPGTPLMVEAIYPEWATPAAPLILADASVYGRPGRLLPEPGALEGNRRKLLERIEIPRAAGIPFIYTGGIDPLVRGADPEFSGKNAVMISEVTDGYWIFYEGPTYTEQDHADYWKWFTWANRAIAGGDFQAQHDPRQTPDGWLLELFEGLGEGRKLVPPAATRGVMKLLPTVRLRRENLLVLACEAGKPVRVTLKHRPVARYEDSLAWDVRDSKSAQVASGTIPYDQTGDVTFTPGCDGVFLLGATAGGCAYSVVSSNVPVGLCAGGDLQLIGGAGKLYFQVPEGLEQFSLEVRGAGGETVRVNVFDPQGEQAATGQTSLSQEKVEVAVQVGQRPGAVWSLELTKADEGVLEDATIRLGPGPAPVLALVPEDVFGVGE